MRVDQRHRSRRTPTCRRRAHRGSATLATTGRRDEHTDPTSQFGAAHGTRRFPRGDAPDPRGGHDRDNFGTRSPPRPHRDRRRLGAEHVELAEAFAAPTGDPEDRFRRARWSDSPSGTPLLLDALVAFECIVVNEIRSGTHVIFVGQVTNARCREGRALIYQCAAFASPNLSAGPSWPAP